MDQLVAGFIDLDLQQHPACANQGVRQSHCEQPGDDLLQHGFSVHQDLVAAGLHLVEHGSGVRHALVGRGLGTVGFAGGEFGRGERVLRGGLALGQQAVSGEVDAGIGIRQQLGHRRNRATLGGHGLRGGAVHDGVQQGTVGRDLRDRLMQIGLQTHRSCSVYAMNG